jgi:two-component system sensor histidine kinase/response regulator
MGSRWRTTSALTAGPVEGKSRSAEPAARRRSAGCRILLVEDNPVNQKLARYLLEKEGHLVVVASDGREALAALEREAFAVVLMDVQMPEMGGMEATAAIREREQGTGRHVPIVAMTAHAMQGDRERCLAAGMDAYLSKPIRREELLEIIRQWAAGVAAGEAVAS